MTAAEPFSTSMFLDLPPTPRRPDDGDDAILAYISRMLLEEEEEGIDDHNLFYQYYPSDHPTLLQAQEPYARILSMADTEKDNEDMLNRLAFEKLLPVTSSLLAATSLTREDSNNKRQNIDWDDCLEGETGRESMVKVMVPEPEESSDVVDDMIVNAYGLCLAAMQGLRITMATTGKKRNGRRRSTTTENEAAVDLSTLLVHCAQAVAMDNRRSATELLLQIRQHCSPSGDATQRLAHCFAQGLEARLAGSGSQVYKSSSLVGNKQRTSLVELLRAYRLYTAACCFNMTSYKFANMAICKARCYWEEEKGAHRGLWHQLRVPVANLAALHGDLGGRSAGECCWHGHSPSPRDVVLGNIRKMKPDAFILNVTNGSYGNPFFVTRFRELMLHYSAMFDMLDATVPRDSDLRMLVERDLFRQRAFNAIACEGSDRVERPETYKQWQVRNHRAGLRQLPLDPDLVKLVREKVKEQFHKDFIVDVDQRWLLKGWKGRMLYAMSTWAVDE
ncbi:unnamed protein product [Urochloa decumbens]|uniref:Scarecrow-like protein 9 n=1 Tax=Urochloa decumbens TaxID=240449 RepID=A0ABC9H7I4_9POAL